MGELASLAAGLMARIGALPLLFIRVASPPELMLAAKAFGRVQPGIEEAGGDAYGALVRLTRILLGRVLGYSSTS